MFGKSFRKKALVLVFAFGFGIFVPKIFFAELLNKF
jgi:hypothetical protein